jgi:hypothetical protein
VIPALLFGAAVLAAPAEPRDAGLDRGIRHVDAAEWNEAIVALSDVVRRLGANTERQREVAEASLYLGVAYAGLGQRSPAMSQFSQALLRDPEIRLDPTRAPKEAVEIFDEARRETEAAVAARKPQTKGRKAVGTALLGAAVVGAGVAVAAGGGNGSGATPTPPAIPSTFTPTSSTGEPQILILDVTPPSSSRVSLSQGNPPLSMAFTFLNSPALPSRVQIRMEMITAASGRCLNGTSEILTVNRAIQASVLAITALHVTCALPFDTTAMNVRLFDADANIPVSLTSYAGGYRFEP